MSKKSDLKNSKDTNLRTSKEWYELDKLLDILDADGWNRSSVDHSDWFIEKISYQEYMKRRSICTIGNYMSNGHRDPFANAMKCVIPSCGKIIK